MTNLEPGVLGDKLTEIEHIVDAYELKTHIEGAFAVLVVAKQVGNKGKQSNAVKVLEGLADFISQKMRR